MIRKTFHYFLRLFVHFYLGKNIAGEDHLIKSGPAIIVANHNSHVDAIVLLSIFSCKEIVNVNVVGAADYFFKNIIFAWMSKNILGIIPLIRHKVSSDIFSEIHNSLDQNKIVIMFPEGSRGEPGKFGSVKKGIGRISEKYPLVAIYPIKLTRTEDSMPKGQHIPIPFIINLDIKNKIFYTTRDEVIESIRQSLSE